MAEYIDKQAALADLNETYDKMAAFHPQFYSGYQFAVNRLRCLPKADVAEVRHGKWIVLGQRTYGSGRCYTHYCSECGQHGFDDYKGCPGCLAKMDGGSDND